MSALCIALSDLPVGVADLSPLQPTGLAEKSPEQIRRTRIQIGSKSYPLQRLAEISGEDTSDIRISGTNVRCTNIGRGMASGRLTVDADVGDFLGAEMSGGEIIVAGNAANNLGSGMRGGVIRLDGDAGDCVGGPLPGATKGMNEGAILVHGNAGATVGQRMRRGLIIVDGDVGDNCADRMIAGTILVGGTPGRELGAGMRRGTILLPRSDARLPKHFAPCGEFELAMIPLLADWFGQVSTRHQRLIKRFSRAARYAGDLTYGGNGEILIPVTQPG